MEQTIKGGGASVNGGTSTSQVIGLRRNGSRPRLGSADGLEGGDALLGAAVNVSVEEEGRGGAAAFSTPVI